MENFVVQSFSRVQLFVTPWIAACQAFLTFTISRNLLSPLCLLSWWCYPSISSSVTCLSSCPQSFPASESFPVSQLFTSGGQSTGASVSASVLLMSIQGWFPLGLTDLISLLSKGLSKSYPAPQFESINSLMFSLLYGPTLTFIHDYWKNHNSDYTDFCQQSNISAF